MKIQKQSFYLQALILVIPLAILAAIGYILFVTLAFIPPSNDPTFNTLVGALASIFIYTFFPIIFLNYSINLSGNSLFLTIFFELIWLYILALVIMAIYKKLNHKS